MGTLRQLFKLKGSAWSLLGGFLLAGLLGGCSHPFIDIKVDVDVNSTCASGGGPRQPLPGAGACSVDGTGAIPQSPTSQTICKNSGGTVINCPPGATCTSGNKCNTPSGTDNRKACKTIWTQVNGTSGSCICTGYY